MSLSLATIQEGIADDNWELRATLRAMFRRSLYAYVKTVTCLYEPENLMDAETFKESCDWLQNVVLNTKRGLYEDPRGHIKTTRSTRSIPPWLSIQRPDPRYDFPKEVDRALAFLDKHPHLKGPDSRLVIGSDSKERAADFVGSTKTDWETNTILRFIAPELIWENYNRLPYGEWSRTSYTLNGRINQSLPDPFLRAVGLDSKVQGGRAEGIIIDDLVGETSYRSAAELERRKAWLRTVGFLLENRDYEHPGGGFILVVGNRWSLDDVNSDIHNNFGDWDIWHRSSYKCIIHLAGNCGRWDDKTERTCADSDEPLWTGRYPNAESLDRVERDVGPELFAAQFRNDPTIIAELDAAKFQPFRLSVETTTINKTQYRGWCAVVPKLDGRGVEIPEENEIIPLTVLSPHLVSIDPASSKDIKNARTCVSWFAMDKPTSRVFWLACHGGHWSTDEAPREALKVILDVRSKTGAFPRILIEKVAAQEYFSTALKLNAELQGLKNLRMPTPEMIPPVYGVAKEDRIRRRVGHRLNQGLLLLRAGLQLPKYEARHFPTGTKDALDTHVQAEEVFQNILGSTRSDALAKARRRKRKARLASADTSGVPL